MSFQSLGLSKLMQPSYSQNGHISGTQSTFQCSCIMMYMGINYFGEIICKYVKSYVICHLGWLFCLRRNWLCM